MNEAVAPAEVEANYEYDREPVAEHDLLGAGYFAGSFAGEHIAATEFVIGASFVSWGASIGDVFAGLALGNLLAVLNWRYLCAPIAVETRLTLYWYLQRIGGRLVTSIANVLNAILYCALAGAMITVSASAVRIPFGIPAQTGLYPTDPWFVLLVLVVGGVVTWIAIGGFKGLATFSLICSPWMIVMFLAGAITVLPALGRAVGIGAPRSFADLWDIGRVAIWTGETADGAPGLGFWHVAAFSWVCNLAMNAGLSDMAVLRYARKADYAWFAITGSFIGHYFAWIAAGVMGAGAAALLREDLAGLDSGAVAFAALGWSGVLAVVIAGWTTANPTIYRAGLALQAVGGGISRTRVTLVVGVVTTLIACSPFVFTRLLDFVGIYGLLLCPLGAIVLTEHWLFPHLGLRRYWLEETKSTTNVPAIVAWAGSIGLGWILNLAGVHLFFLFVPVYASTSLLYLLLARAVGAGKKSPVPSVSDDASSSEGSPPDLPSSNAPRGDRLVSDDSDRSLSDGVRSEGSRGPIVWVAASVALVALAACVWLPVGVYLADAGSYDAALVEVRTGLAISTAIYFVASVIALRSWAHR